MDAALPQQLAQLLAVRPGARLTLGDAFGRPVTVRVTGVYTAQGNAGFWPGMAGDPTAAQGAANSLFVVSPAALNGTAALNGQVTACWSAQGDFAGAAANQLAGLRDRAVAFAGSHGAQPPLSRMTVVSSLPQAVDALAAPVAVARSALYQPTALLAVLALTALVLTARQLAEHRSGELALQQARGAGTGRLLAAAAAEWGLTGIPAAVAAPFLAQLLVRSALGPAGWTAAVLTLAVQGTAVLLPVLHPALLPLFRRISVPRRRDARRRTGAVAVQRAGLDLALAVVALLGWLELAHHHAVVQGASVAAGPVSVPAVDPVLVLAPVVACVAASLLLFRLMPLTSRLLDRYGRRRAGLVLPLAGWQLSRRSARNAGPVLLMCLAAAVGALSGTALACLDGLALDQARFAVGADVRVDTSAGGGYAPSVLAGAYRALPGVTAVTPVTLTSRVGAALAPLLVSVSSSRSALGRPGSGSPSGVIARSPPPRGPPSRSWAPTRVPQLPAFGSPDLLVAHAPGGSLSATVQPYRKPVVHLRFSPTGTLAAAEQDDPVLGPLTSLIPDGTPLLITTAGVEQRLPQLSSGHTAVLLFGGGAHTSAAALHAAAGRLPGPLAQVTVRTEALAALRGDGLTQGVGVLYTASTLLAVLFALLAVTLELVLTAPERGRTTSYLRTLGLTGRGAAVLHLVQLLPLVPVAALGGVVLGLLEPRILGPALDLRAFTGGPGRPALHTDPALTLALGLGAALLVLAAAVAETLLARTRTLAARIR